MQEILQKFYPTSKPIYDAKRCGGTDHKPEFITTLTLTIQGKELKAQSNPCTNKQTAKKDAAQAMLRQLQQME